jgi:uncharacterized membrane protein
MTIIYCPNCRKPISHAVVTETRGMITTVAFQCVGCYRTSKIDRKIKIKKKEQEDGERWETL